MPEVEINEQTGIATVAVTQQIAEVNVTESESSITVQISATQEPEIIQVGIIGPQGPQGIQGLPGSTSLEELEDVDISLKVPNSVLYYKQSQGKFVADDVNTIITLTDGGNF